MMDGSEPPAEVMDVKEGRLAPSGLVESSAAEKAVLVRLIVGIGDEDEEELKCVGLRFPLGIGDQLELVPVPGRILALIIMLEGRARIAKPIARRGELGADQGEDMGFLRRLVLP